MYEASRSPLLPIHLHNVRLDFLPAFEAAGRLGSFAAAAAELHVTPSAISQQIRSLETTLGVTLFERNGRTASLTWEGKRYLEEVRESLTALAASIARLRRSAEGTVLRLHTVALVAHEFLLPRLAAFCARFPSLELRVETSNEFVDFRRTDCDAALRFGNHWPDLTIKRLGTAVAAVVCSPALAADIRSVADLQRYTLLAPTEGEHGFAMLMAEAGLPLKAAKVWRFETCHEALRAAEHGLGVALGVFPTSTHWVNAGRLAVPLSNRLHLPGRVSFVYRPRDEARFPLAEIAQWLTAEYQALPSLASGRIVPELCGKVSTTKRSSSRE